MKIPFKNLILLVLVIVLSELNICFSQCSTTTVFTENFDDNTITSTVTSGPVEKHHKVAALDGNQSKGSYDASCGSAVKITNNVHAFTGGSDQWRKNTTVAPAELPTGNDTGSDADFAMLVDGCGSVADGSVWCTSISVSPGEIYDFSAYFTSPWLSDKTNDPAIYLTVNGVQIGVKAIVEQYNNSSEAGADGPPPYSQLACYYTVPAGTSGSVPFCINMQQVSGGVYGSVNGQGNDFLVDDIVINKRSGSGCPASGTCTYPGIMLPVKLLRFGVKMEPDNTVSLNWSTTSEKNFSHFFIEKSTDGINFSEIGKVNSKGLAFAPANYEFWDFDFHNTSYYRLKMVDLDGSGKYSNIIILTNSNSRYCKVFKKESGELEIRVNAQQNGSMNVLIYSILGQKYTEDEIYLSEGTNVIIKDFYLRDKNVLLRIISSDGELLFSGIVSSL